MKRPYLLAIHGENRRTVTVRQFGTPEARARAIRKLPPGTDYTAFQYEQLFEIEEDGSAKAYDPRYEIPF